MENSFADFSTYLTTGLGGIEIKGQHSRKYKDSKQEFLKTIYANTPDNFSYSLFEIAHQSSFASSAVFDVMFLDAEHRKLLVPLLAISPLAQETEIKSAWRHHCKRRKTQGETTSPHDLSHTHTPPANGSINGGLHPHLAVDKSPITGIG